MLRATTACTFRHLDHIWTSISLPNMWWCCVHFEFHMCFEPQPRSIFGHLNFQKWSALRLTSKCASRYNGVYFLDTATSKSDPGMVCFVHFDFQICFASQRPALLRNHNFRKRSGAEVLCAVSLPDVLGATTACTFSTSQLPKLI